MISTSTMFLLHATSAPHWHTFEITAWMISFGVVLAAWSLAPRIASRLRRF